ncbi:MAG: FtsX-like permease family protein [Alteromonadaceae bacterium]|nr:FtsX-like permease family protein [Alteromonadaceae bacterium]
MPYFNYIIKSYLKDWRKVALIFLSLIIGCAGLVSVLLVNETANNTLQAQQVPFSSQVHYMIKGESGDVTKAQYVSVRKAGIEAVPTKSVAITLPDDNQAQLTGIDFFAFPLAQERKLNLNEPSSTASGLVVFASPTIAEKYSAPVLLTGTSGAKLRVNVLSNGQDNLAQHEKSEPIHLYADINIATTLSEATSLSHLWLFNELTIEQRQALAALKLTIVPNQIPNTNLSNSFKNNTLAMALLMFIVAIFVISNSVNLLLVQRLKNINIFYQLGISKHRLIYLQTLEIVTLGLIGGLVGYVIGVFGAQALHPFTSKTFTNLFYLSVSSIEMGNFIGFSLLAGVSGVAFALVLSLKMMSLNPKQHKTTSNLRRNVQHSSIIGIFVLLSFSLPITSILWQYVIIAGLLLFGCHLMTWLLTLINRIIAKTIPQRFPIARFFFFDAQRVLGGSAIAFCAFFIAITANVGMNTMVDSFRTATGTWIEQQFNADLYVASPAPVRLLKELSKFEPQLAVYQRHKTTLFYKQQLTEVISFENAAYQVLPLQFTAVIKPPTSVEKIYINQQMSRRHNLSVGEYIKLAGVNVVVAGIYIDYGNVYSQVHWPDANFVSLNLPSVGVNRFALTLNGVDPKTQDAVENTLDSLEQTSYFSSQQIRDITITTFDRTFLFTGGLNSITLLVALFSLLISVILMERYNRAQHTLLYSFGIVSLQQMVLNLAQYLVQISIIFIFAVPFALALSWLLIYRVNLDSFQWSYPLLVSPSQIVTLYIYSVLACSLALLITLVYRNRSSISERLALS